MNSNTQLTNQHPIMFSTFDLGLSSSLFTLGHTLIEIDKTNSKKACFYFSRNVSIEKDAEAYWAGRLKLDAKSFFDSIRCIKNQLYTN